VHHERTVRQVVEPRDVVALRTGVAIDPFQMEPCVDRVGASRSRMDPAPDRGETIVVISAAERAGPMSRGEGGASSRKNSSVNRPGCIRGARCQPRNVSRHAIHRFPS